ncbi:MAG: phosphoribosylamine--glycine ligase [Lysobacter sp.]|nr:phosphoribosylamine--glycine ligase [Lysobacter sp.]
MILYSPALWFAYWFRDSRGAPAAVAQTQPAAARSVVKVLVIGSGGREHALAWKLAQSRRVAEVIVAPGNAGTATERKCRNVDIQATDIEGLLQLARRENIGLTVIGPEGPLVAGLADRFRTANLRVFGPSAAAARLEGSKAYAKDFLTRHQIPTADYAVHTQIDEALAYVRHKGAPIVIKADGLAAGKGVIVATSLAEAEAAVTDALSGNAFGAAGARVVIEEFLDGEEASFISMVDGRTALPLATSQDHKRAFDGDTGPNTGGMGAYSPAAVVTPQVHARVMREVVEPTVRGMIADGIAFTGFLYAGLMIDKSGAPKVIEFNVRLGDPETQPMMMRLQSDLLELIEAALDKQLHTVDVRWNPRPALGVVMAAANYPDAPRSGDAIQGLGVSIGMEQKVFHGGTKLTDGQVVTAGGRVLCVCALGDTVADAQDSAHQAVSRIAWEGMFHRSDIGWRAIERERAGT